MEYKQGESQPPVSDGPMMYAPAEMWRRLVNYILDRVAFVIILIAISPIALALFDSEIASGFLALFDLIFYILYFIFFEGIWQRTPAKWITKTKVVMRDGGKPPFWNVVGRSFARIIPFEQFSFLFGAFPRGWHDRMSGTLVVPASYSADDVKKIDIEAVKKVKGDNTIAIVIIVFMSLLVIIAIIGIISSVVLVSLNSARQKGNEAQVRSVLTSMRAEAELYAYNHKDYGTASSCDTGMFAADPAMQQEIAALNGKPVTCYAKPGSYAISAVLNSDVGNSFCVDSNAYSGAGIATDNGTSVSCR